MNANESSVTLIRVCSASELAPGKMTRVPVSPPIAVCNIAGEYCAFSDTCTHEQSSLSEEGYLDGDEIECGWHYAKFCVRTGAVTMPPATVPLQCYAVRVQDGDLYVVVPQSD